MKACRVQEYYFSNLRSSRRAVNSAPKTVTNQFGNQTTMVNMGMGQENGVQGMGREGKGIPVPAFKLSFLIKPAINQKPGVISL